MNNKLEGWKEDIKHLMMFQDLSAHDALCHLLERDLHPLSEAECEELMSNMDSYWG